MRIPIFSVLLIAFISDAHADYFRTLVGYECDVAANKIILTYLGAYNEAGDSLVQNKTDDQWDPWSLIEM